MFSQVAVSFCPPGVCVQCACPWASCGRQLSFPRFSTACPPLIPMLPTHLSTSVVHKFWITHVEKLWMTVGNFLRVDNHVHTAFESAYPGLSRG